MTQLRKPFDWEDLAKVGKRLEEATERMYETICDIEDLILEKLGELARGRVELRRGETSIYEKNPKNGIRRKLLETRQWVESLAYLNGEMFIESNRSGPRFTSTHILSTSREIRVLAMEKIPALWEACGGTLPIRRPSV